jgi:DNA polymerase elongation subunit (family B)
VVYRQIEDLFDDFSYDEDSEGNQVCNGNSNVMVWSDVGWTSVKYIVRKPMKEPLTRVLTHTGCVDVTEEHSLLYEDGREVKTADVKVGEELLHYPVPLPNDIITHELDFSDDEEQKAYALGKIFSRQPEEGDYHYRDLHTSRGDKKIPDHILNSDFKIRNAFFCGCKDENYVGEVIECSSHLGAAQLAYLAKSLGYYTSVSHSSSHYVIHYSKQQLSNTTTIQRLSRTTELFDYVYDIETSSHHFAAGIGDLIVHNSAYGGMGAQTGFIPFVAGAESVTAMGRKQITLTVDMLEKQLGNVVVYGDTDSAMSQNGCDNPQDAINKTKADGKLITHYLKLWSLGLPPDHHVTVNNIKYTIDAIKHNDSVYNQLSIEDKKLVLLYARLPLDLEFEKMYGVMMLLTKKRYFATIVNEKGEVTGFDKKGCVLSRRDNCDFLKKTYKKLADMIVTKKPGETAFIKTPEAESIIMNIIYDRIHDLFTRQVPDCDLVIYIGIGSLLEYAKKTEIKNARNEVIATPFIDFEGKPIDDVVGPLDPRLVYPNIPQCLLALKMTKRGINLPSNIRLEFLYVENKDWLHQGDKAEDYAYYMENKSYLGLKPDLLHYVEKQFAKPIGELIDVLFPRENIMYRKLETWFKDLLNSNEMEEIKRQRLFKLKNMLERMRPIPRIVSYKTFDVASSSSEVCCDYVCGWDVYEVEKNTREIRAYINQRKEEFYYSSYRDTCFDRYRTSGILNVRAQYIVDNARDHNDPFRFSQDSDYEAELIYVAQRWTHRYVLDRLHRQNKIQIRPTRKSTQAGDGLAVGTEVMVAKEFGGYPKRKILRVVNRTITEEIRKKKIYEFDLIDPETNDIITGVSRDVIAPFYRKDGKVMEDIVKYRTFYSRVVSDLNYNFGLLNIPDVIMKD